MAMKIHSGRRELRSSMNGFTNRQGLQRQRGHGRKVRTPPNGQELKALPSHINLFQSIRQIVQIQMKSHLLGETLEISIPAMTTSIRTIQWKSVQYQKSDQLETEQQQSYMQMDRENFRY